MAADNKVAGLFNLVIDSPPSQDVESCEIVIDLLVDFYDSVVDDKSHHPWITETELGALGPSLEVLLAEAPEERIDYMPEYGCALMKSKAGCASGVIALNLISLDLHQFETRSERTPDGYHYVDNASSGGYQVLHVGKCHLVDLEARQELFSSKLAAARTRTGDKRSAAGGEQGHQRTPGFVHALYREAFGMQQTQLARGGWTDVGMHTGGQERRPTAWSLVTSCLYQLLHNRSTSIRLSSDKLYRKFVPYFGLYTWDGKLRLYDEQSATSEPRSNAPDMLLDKTFRILQAASILAAALSDDGVDMSHFLHRSKSIRDQIVEKASSRSHLFSKRYELHLCDKDIIGVFDNYSFNIPAGYSPADGASSTSKARKLTRQNIGWAPVLVGNRLKDVYKWVKESMSTPSRDSSFLVLKSVECVIWENAKNMRVTMTSSQLIMLASIVDNYREVLHNLKESQKYKPISLKELMSCEFLVVWVAFCIIHNSVAKSSEYGAAINGYGVPLEYNDLSNLVLSDPIEWDVALLVAEYLAKFGTSRPIFSLRDEAPTFEMGGRVANASQSLVNVWMEEKKDALRRVDDHWNKVSEKMELVRNLCAEITRVKERKAKLNETLANKQEELRTHEQEQYYYRRYPNRECTYDSKGHSLCRSHVEGLEEAVSKLESWIASCEIDLRSAQEAPPPVFQPLPFAREKAMPIIFFLYMPLNFQLLARFSFTAQQLRLPHPWSAAMSGSEGTENIDITRLVTRGNKYCQDSWTDYYNELSSSYEGSDSWILLRSSRKDSVPKPHEVGPRNVQRMTSRSDGIWYPDEMEPRMAWFGGPKPFDYASSGAEINPFIELDHFIIASSFTERLEDISLQWTLMQPGEEYILSSRGNLPYARQNTKPEWLSKTQYLSFANLRSYPHIQLINILLAIHERQLPFTEPSVHILIRQALFHIGKISHERNGHATLEWKRDLESPRFCTEARLMLESFCAEIKDSPQRYMCVKLIGEICNFFSKWEHGCRITAQNLAYSVYQWAEELDGEIEKSALSLAPEIRAKQVVLYQHAILVIIGGNSLIDSDVSLLIKMVVKSKNIFTDDVRSDEILPNAIDIKYGISQKLKDIRQVVMKAPNTMTDALRSVISRCPNNLNWHPWAPEDHVSTQCFEARGVDECFTINLISGEVLINGLPPSRLPQSILAHPLYMRTFGDSNFEVVGKGDFLETRYPICGKFYRFSKGTSLTIYEFKEDGSELLELLDGTGEVFSWAMDLPIRLKSMHSHWLLRESNLIVLRGIRFDERDVSFLIELDASGTKRIIKGRVKCVDVHCEERDRLSYLKEEMHTMDTLVLHEHSKALDIISKFESKTYIQTLTKSDFFHGKNVRFFLPRYELTFAVADGVLHCREIAGYHLCPQQQIDNTLRGVEKYLLLEESKTRDKIIVFPKGKVVRESSGQVHIEVKDNCDEKLLWYQYKFHPRFRYIETKQSRASRMQLVALHVATSTSLPDEMLCMTGEERALTLLRESWANCPLSDEECLVLDNIKQLAHGLYPTVSLLCDDIEMSSKQFSFLYSNTGVNHDCTVTKSYEESAYLNNVKNNKISIRCYLTPREEEQVIGLESCKPVLLRCLEPNQQLPPSPVGSNEVESLQRRLDEIQIFGLCSSGMGTDLDHSFPLNIIPSSKLERDMINELRASWNAHVRSTSHSHTESVNLNIPNNAIREIQDDVVEMRHKVENFALDALNQVLEQTNSNWHDNAHRMLRVAGIVPTAIAADLAKIAIHPVTIENFNPMIEDYSHLLESISTWLRLCVYEDKLARLLSFFRSESVEEVITELNVKTIWNTSKHPYWLVFEVENGLQIRQDQYKVAQHLIDNPGDVIQLNMGLGKTRVILPMLVLHRSFHKDNSEKQQYARSKVTRLHFLSALFQEAYTYLHNNLSASILGVKIYTMPFCRDFPLDLSSVATMKSAIDDCRICGGALVVAPEHRLSLELKVKEMHHNGEHDIAARIEQDILEQDIWCDIIDECDEVLRHRYQLIYAIGKDQKLPGGINRWRAVQAILSVLTHNEEIQEFLHLHPKACKLVNNSRSEWGEIQFFDGESLEEMLARRVTCYQTNRPTNQPSDQLTDRPTDCCSPRLQEGLLDKVADAIIRAPPHELEWMRDHPLKVNIKNAMIEKDIPADHLRDLSEQRLTDVLALRGFLVGGLLRHCLLKRHRVDFGIVRPGKNRVAVPFRFADTPDERSEFAHPDCAVAFTVLAYYHDGLKRHEFELALEALFSQGKSAQRNFYNCWFQAMTVDPVSFETFDCVEKIDTSNRAQFEKLWRVYRRNIHTINFYLNYCVLPYETAQFDKRLTATSWNLAQNKSNSIVGFSGTNDNHRILPLQVRQYFASKEEHTDPILNNLEGTNGRT